MSIKKRLSAILLVICLAGAAIFFGKKGVPGADEMLDHTGFGAKDTLHFWYTDEALTDFVNSAALEYYENTGYRVVPKLVSGLEYLEQINQASLSDKELPDLFVATNDTLEKAYLAGLSSEITDQSVKDTSVFCQTAQDAVTYQGKLVGYPFYYETSVFLYNETYLKDVAEAAETSEEKLIPKSFDDILTFSDNYDAPENVEAILKWDVSDIFYNYFFVGKYMKTGGDTGDDVNQIDINNEKVRNCLQMYQNLNQFFSIDAKEVSYDSILQEFMEGKIVYTIVTTDALGRLEEAKKQGDFPYEYGVMMIPDVSEGLETRSLSVTDAVVVNGYSQKQEAANRFAMFLTKDKAGELYEGTGKISAREGVSYENEKVKECMAEYHDSISMPKMIETSSFWVQLEIGFTKIWTGEDIQSVLDELNEQMKIKLG